VREREDVEDEVARLAVDQRLALLEEGDLVAVGRARLDRDGHDLGAALELDRGAVLADARRVLLVHARPDLLRDDLVAAVALARPARGDEHVAVARDAEGVAQEEVAQRRLERDVDRVALGRLLLAAAAAEAKAAKAAAAEELGEDVLRGGAAAAAALAAHLAEAILAVLVVHAPLLGVGQHLVRCAGGRGEKGERCQERARAESSRRRRGGASKTRARTVRDLGELVRRALLLLLVPLHLVRVHLQRELAVGPLDRRLVGAARDVEDVVVVPPEVVGSVGKVSASHWEAQAILAPRRRRRALTPQRRPAGRGAAPRRAPLRYPIATTPSPLIAAPGGARNRKRAREAGN
jgi:hypothetical protein